MANVSEMIVQLEKDMERADEQAENARRVERLEQEKEAEALWDRVHGR